MTKLVQVAVFALILATQVVAASAQNGIPWENDLEAALQKAKQENKLVLLHFWHHKCGPCKKLDTFVFNTDEVTRTIGTDFIPVKVNTIEQPQISAKYHIQSVPQDLVLLPSGHVIYQQISPSNARNYAQMLAAATQEANRPQPGRELQVARAIYNNDMNELPVEQVSNNEVIQGVAQSRSLQDTNPVPAFPQSNPESLYAQATAQNPALANQFQNSAIPPRVNSFNPSGFAQGMQQAVAGQVAGQVASGQAAVNQAIDQRVNAANQTINQQANAAQNAINQQANTAQQAINQQVSAAQNAIAPAVPTGFGGQGYAPGSIGGASPPVVSTSSLNNGTANSPIPAPQAQANPYSTPVVAQPAAATSGGAFGTSSTTQPAPNSTVANTQSPVAPPANTSPSPSRPSGVTAGGGAFGGSFAGANATPSAIPQAQSNGPGQSPVAASQNQPVNPVNAQPTSTQPPVANVASNIVPWNNSGTQPNNPSDAQRQQGQQQGPGGAFAPQQGIGQAGIPQGQNPSQNGGGNSNSQTAPNGAGQFGPMIPQQNSGQVPAGNPSGARGSLESRSAQPNPAPNQNAAPQADKLPPLGLKGFCPVALMETQVWQEGNRAFGVRHRGRLYLFCCEGHLAKFMQAPDNFAPILSGYDPVIFADQQKLVDGRPEYGVFAPGSGVLILFASEETLKAYEANPQRYLGIARQAMGEKKTTIR